MLSHLCSFTLVDAHHRHTKLTDLVVALLEDDYPPVTHLCFSAHTKQLLALPWEAVQSIDWPVRHITLADGAAGHEVPLESLTQPVLLSHDILDALIMDLQQRRVTRANDLWLEEEGGRLRLRAADTSARAILRRLSRGRYGQGQARVLSDWKYMEFLRGDPHAVQAGAVYHRRITRLPAGEIAHLTDPLPSLSLSKRDTTLHTRTTTEGTTPRTRRPRSPDALQPPLVPYRCRVSRRTLVGARQMASARAAGAESPIFPVTVRSFLPLREKDGEVSGLLSSPLDEGWARFR